MNLSGNLRKPLAGAFFVMFLFLGACSNTPHRPLVDGGDLADYETDLTQCQEFAAKEQEKTDATAKNAGTGAAVGGLLGATQGLEEGVAGAVIGAIITGGASALTARKELKNLTIKCMQDKGYNVVEASN